MKSGIGGSRGSADGMAGPAPPLSLSRRPRWQHARLGRMARCTCAEKVPQNCQTLRMVRPAVSDPWSDNPASRHRNSVQSTASLEQFLQSHVVAHHRRMDASCSPLQQLGAFPGRELLRIPAIYPPKHPRSHLRYRRRDHMHLHRRPPHGIERHRQLEHGSRTRTLRSLFLQFRNGLCLVHLPA